LRPPPPWRAQRDTYYLEHHHKRPQGLLKPPGDEPLARQAQSALLETRGNGRGDGKKGLSSQEPA